MRWFVDLFSELFLPNLFGMLRADSQEALDEVKDKLDNGLKVSHGFMADCSGNIETTLMHAPGRLLLVTALMHVNT